MPDSKLRAEALLDRLRSPEDLHALAASELPPLCEEIRSFLLESVQRTGGHLGSNLGVVELTVALHRVFDFRRDRLVFDVSHQSYVHKILTGRKEGFDRLRRTGGLCGFTHPAESEYDLFHMGHAGTSISLGLGLAKAAAHEADPPSVVSVIGDASLGAGVAFEALNHAGASGVNMLVVLNDNEWSISKSVGALARYLTRIRSARVVQRAQQEIHGLLQSIPLIGKKVEDVIEQMREVLRHTIVQGHVFEEFGVTYVGPVDGHDVDYLVESLERVRKLEGVVLLHTLTQKGKGHPDALTHPERMHAAKPTAPKVSTPVSAGVAGDSGRLRKCEAASVAATPVPARSYTQAFADSLRAIAERDVRVHAITAGMPSGTGLLGFQERFPNRFHDVGICEQHAVAMAAGMAKAGLRPVVAIYSTFLQRAYDQVFQEVALQHLPVTFALDRAGLVGQDGPTHNGVFDLAYLRVLPGIALAAPRDETDMRRMLDAAIRRDEGPMALRFPRDLVPSEELLPAEERAPMEAGRAEVLIDGGELVLWASGALVRQGREAIEALRARGVDAGLVDARFVKPLDEELLAQHLRTKRHIVSLEEHQRSGGLGSAMLEAAGRLPVGGGARGEQRARIRTLGVPDRYIEHASSRDEQLASLGLDAEGVARSLAGILRASLV
ncbi:MAG TPA: 1-deoxy-D-xylulose-5-phosphate synthase [Planctomycetes bacterium]|nr:1-deoxy-D-xylulose-5-phosphate synthase [Planctomycetota bacterium]